MQSNGRIKIFLLIPSLVQGGAERQILELIRHLPARFDPVLCLFNGERIHYRDLLPPGQPRHVLGVDAMTPAGFVRLVRLIRQERPAIFHSYLNRANFWGRLAALHARVPVVIASCRARMIEWRYLPFERPLARRSQLVIANSVGIQHELENIGVPRSRIALVPNFLDLEHFRPPTDAERAAARERWAIGVDQQAVLVPGRICLQKHQLSALLAFRELIESGELAGDPLLLLAGRMRGGTIGPLVRRLVQTPPLRRRVRLLGAQRDIRSLYWAADLALLPSLWEGLPNTALEGCACGLPALLSHAANLDGIVDPGASGLEFPTADRAALRTAMASMLNLDDQQRRTRGACARKRMEARFSPDEVCDKLVSTYDRLLDQQLAAIDDPSCAG